MLLMKSTIIEERLKFGSFDGYDDSLKLQLGTAVDGPALDDSSTETRTTLITCWYTSTYRMADCKLLNDRYYCVWLEPVLDDTVLGLNIQLCSVQNVDDINK